MIVIADEMNKNKINKKGANEGVARVHREWSTNATDLTQIVVTASG